MKVLELRPTTAENWPNSHLLDMKAAKSRQLQDGDARAPICRNSQFMGMALSNILQVEIRIFLGRDEC